MAKHTPGPWHWCGERNDPNYDGIDGFSLRDAEENIILSATDSWACEMPGRTDQVVISKAPEMFDILKRWTEGEIIDKMTIRNLVASVMEK